MQNIEIHVLHVGNVRVSSNLPYGGESCSKLKAAGIFEKAEKRLWLPVSSYLIKHPKGLILVDTGWHREMSPEGTFDKKAQVKSLGTFPLYMVNQGIVKKGMTVDEQLETMGITPSDIDYVLVTHLDCDHANGLRQVCDAKNILVAKEELKSAARMHNKIRYNRAWWKGIEFTPFEWNGHLGPVNKSYDLFGDGSVQLINIPGHADGLFAVQIFSNNGNFVLLYSDGGYSDKSWKEMILPGIADNRILQKKSLEWIKSQCVSENCIEALANHDSDVSPHVIKL